MTTPNAPHGPQHPFPPFGPPKQGAIDRVLRYARNATIPVLGASLALLALEHFMPVGSRPSDAIGGFHGSIEAAEMEAKRVAATRLAEEMARAQATPPAMTAIEVEIARQQAERLAQSLEAQTLIGNGADYLCVIGQMIPRNSRDWKDVGESLRSACGVSETIRGDMMETMARNMRNGSGIIQRPAPQRPPVR